MEGSRRENTREDELLAMIAVLQAEVKKLTKAFPKNEAVVKKDVPMRKHASVECNAAAMGRILVHRDSPKKRELRNSSPRGQRKG